MRRDASRRVCAIVRECNRSTQSVSSHFISFSRSPSSPSTSYLSLSLNSENTMTRQFFVGGNFKLNPTTRAAKQALVKTLNEATVDPNVGQYTHSYLSTGKTEPS